MIFLGAVRPRVVARPFSLTARRIPLRPEHSDRALAAPAPRTALLVISLLAASPAHASIFSGDTLDAVANGIAWFVLAVVPTLVIALFWIVHVMPEKIAHKRHHPQAEAIHTLCLLSLVFGGLLWPIAWLWAYTKPTHYRLAYGTDKHDELSPRDGRQARAGKLSEHELAHLRDELDAIAARGALPPELEWPARAARCDAAAARRPARRKGPPDGRLILGLYAALRLADLLQVQVAAVEHHVDGDRHHHPDRRADDDDPAAQRVRAVDRRRARHQVRGQRRAAGRRPRARGAGRAEPAGEEGRGAVPDRSDAVRAHGQEPRGAARQRPGQRTRARRAGRRRRRHPGRGARLGAAGRRPGARSPGQARLARKRVEDNRELVARGAGDRFALETAETDAQDARRRSSRPRAACSRSRAAPRSQAAASERQVRERLGGKVGNVYAPVAQVRAQLDNARWQLEQTTVVAPADGYAINVQLRAGSFTAAFPITPAMTFVENTYQVIALYHQNELHQVEPGNEAEFILPTDPGHIFKAKVDSIVWAQGQGQVANSTQLPTTGYGPVPPGRFPVKLTVDERDADIFLPAGAIGQRRRSSPSTLAFLHILRKVLLRVERQARLPGPEAALSMARVTLASISPGPSGDGCWRSSPPPRRSPGCALDSPPTPRSSRETELAHATPAAGYRGRRFAARGAGRLAGELQRPAPAAAGRRGAALQRRPARRRRAGRDRRGGAEGGRRRAVAGGELRRPQRRQGDRLAGPALRPARLGLVGDRPLGPGPLRPAAADAQYASARADQRAARQAIVAALAKAWFLAGRERAAEPPRSPTMLERLRDAGEALRRPAARRRRQRRRRRRRRASTCRAFATPRCRSTSRWRSRVVRSRCCSGRYPAAEIELPVDAAALPPTGRHRRAVGAARASARHRRRRAPLRRRVRARRRGARGAAAEDLADGRAVIAHEQHLRAQGPRRRQRRRRRDAVLPDLQRRPARGPGRAAHRRAEAGRRGVRPDGAEGLQRSRDRAGQRGVAGRARGRCCARA